MSIKLSIFFIMIVIFNGCSSKIAQVDYTWKSKNVVIHDNIVILKSNSSKDLQVREIKYYTISQRNRKNGAMLYTTKDVKYLYLNPVRKFEINKSSFQDISKKYKIAILFSGDSICKDKNYPCSFGSLRLKGEIYVNGKKDYNLERILALAEPIEILSEKTMRDKVHSFLLR